MKEIITFNSSEEAEKFWEKVRNRRKKIWKSILVGLWGMLVHFIYS